MRFLCSGLDYFLRYLVALFAKTDGTFISIPCGFVVIHGRSLLLFNLNNGRQDDSYKINKSQEDSNICLAKINKCLEIMVYMCYIQLNIYHNFVVLRKFNYKRRFL